MIRKTKVDAETKRTITEDNKKAKRTRTITENDFVRFADVSGDHNPLHLDAAYAAQTLFGERVAHGMLTASMISPVQERSIWGRRLSFSGLCTLATP